MQPVERLDDLNIEQFKEEIYFAHDPLMSEEDRIQEITNHKYTKTNLLELTQANKTLDDTGRKKLYKLLQMFEHLFDGTLGEWKTDPIELELKDPDCKHYHAKPYPVPHSQ